MFSVEAFNPFLESLMLCRCKSLTLTGPGSDFLGAHNHRIDCLGDKIRPAEYF